MSRLLDLCRQSIVFDSAADMAACLSAVHVDRDVQAIRVKNRLDPRPHPHSDGSRCDSEPVAGYRDVGVNLRITGPAAVRLGLDSHVCELQLLLRPFAELKVLPYTLFVTVLISILFCQLRRTESVHSLTSLLCCCCWLHFLPFCLRVHCISLCECLLSRFWARFCFIPNKCWLHSTQYYQLSKKATGCDCAVFNAAANH